MSGTEDAIKVGDYVKNAAGTEGRVFRVQGNQIRVATAYNQTVTGRTADFEKTSSGLGAAFSTPGISLTEVVQNAAAFALINKVVSKSAYDAEVKNFVIADVITEVYLGSVMINNGITIFKQEDLVPLVGDKAGDFMPSGVSLKQAANKLLAITVADTGIRYFMKQGQYKGRVANLLKTYAALVLGNSLEKQMRKASVPPSFLPR